MGRSALDAVELMDVGWNFRREHLRPEQRSHYVIVNGGNQPNVVPSEATVWYFFREWDYDRIRTARHRHQNRARRREMTDTTVTERVLGAAWPGHFNKPLAEPSTPISRRWECRNGPTTDQSSPRPPRRDEGQGGRRTTEVRQIEEADEGGSAGSDDIAEVSWNLPTVVLRYPANIPGMIGHHWSSAIAMATPIAHKGATAGAKAHAMTAIELLLTPEP